MTGQHPATDCNALQYQRSPATSLLTCGCCGGWYLDDEPCRQAHKQVHDHMPGQRAAPAPADGQS